MPCSHARITKNIYYVYDIILAFSVIQKKNNPLPCMDEFYEIFVHFMKISLEDSGNRIAVGMTINNKKFILPINK
jgi:hypothetical protein